MDWIVEKIDKVRRILGVPQTWNINVRVSDKPGGSIGNAGFCTADAVYENATIELTDSLEKGDDSLAYIIHEVTHVALSGVDLIVERMLEAMSESDRNTLFPLYQSAVETFAQRLSRGIVMSKEELCSLHSSVETVEESQPSKEELEKAQESQSGASIVEAARSLGLFRH